ncbi:putative oxidoreductase [Streptoalloteichus tenebrarius]|uniref:Oxidoreductase n=1 Tax=Streptoalloteichus tenebrarius (strain ATCC 17920 / DSM 40477 / JCM 4838 / CBS 697.72 / NBRC 16177 / NCIMB 11028 / NRRL B-12390 / A12253. 1 / ISP 5477) TaxID=1933 RepID=A0ABT1I2R2_STRSD|nr:aldo/keto reductase [Streptoalloteichus tenebrarius]MCP2262077.1 putative oxidoreductase [Streptoalloteichus tenebrarius]BFF02231.1 aldo/keto reductase [Streptoalloteichus tenebrarius]
MVTLNATDLDVFPLCLGGNVFGWTSDQETSFAVLDAYSAAGGNFVDTADAYSYWAPGNSGGESETIIGRWLAARGNRDDMVIATKCGRLPRLAGLAPATIRTAVEESLRRLGVDHIDLLYAHGDDPDTPMEEALGAFDALVREGKARYLAASNYTPERLSLAREIQRREGFAPFVALQPEYNLMDREGYESGLAGVAADHGLAVFPYYALASGFLTGKYRPGSTVDSARAGGASRYLDERGVRVLAALDELAAKRGTTVSAVALAWLAAQPTVTAPIASARTTEQLADLLPMADLKLDQDELDRLTAASDR